MDKCGVYVIECSANGAFYIGSSAVVSARRREHRRSLRVQKHHSPYLQNAWNKYGEGAFELRVLEECPREDLIAREQEYLDVFQPPFNVCAVAGSRAGVPHPPEVRERIRQALVGRSRPTAHRANLAAARRASPVAAALAASLRGIPRPPHVGQLVRAAKLGKPRHPDVVAKVAASLTGRNLSPEHRAKLSDVRKGRVLSAETRAKVGAARRISAAVQAANDRMRGVPRSMEVREKCSAALKGRPKPHLRGVPRSPEVRAKISATKRAKREAMG